MLGILLYVVCGQPPLVLLTLSPAITTGVTVTLEYGRPPRHVTRVGVTLPRATAFPVRVLITLQKSATLTFGSQAFGFRLSGNNAAFGTCADFGARPGRQCAPLHPLTLCRRPMLRRLTHAGLPRPPQDSAHGDAIASGELGVSGYRISCNEFGVHKLPVISLRTFFTRVTRWRAARTRLFRACRLRAGCARRARRARAKASRAARRGGSWRAGARDSSAAATPST